MTTDAPRELRFDFVADSDESAAPDEDTAALAESNDHASELKRRVAELRSVSRRGHVPHHSLSDGNDREPHDPSETAGAHELAEEPSVDEDDEASLTISQFYERVRRALAQEFEEDIWVSGEIRGLRESRGHRYLELADRGIEAGGRAAQQLEVVCWSRDWPTVAGALQEAGVDLEVGRVVRVRGRVSVWEGGSKLRFTLTSLDVEALVGGIAAARRRLLATLAQEDLLEANRRQSMAIVPLRVGIVTSPGSEAHRDFLGQLSASGYAFDVRIEGSLVQGSEAPNQIARAFERMRAFQPEIVVLIRGGGAHGDLAAFDSEEVARAIATAAFPVWTGIGHTSDRSVADEVAHRALITPTACGEAIVAVVDSYWSEVARLIETATRLATLSVQAHEQAAQGTHAGSRAVRTSPVDTSYRCTAGGKRKSRRGTSCRRLDRDSSDLSMRVRLLKDSVDRATHHPTVELVHRRQVLNAFDPARQMSRGWSLVHDENGRLVQSVEALAKGTRLTTRFARGTALSVVESTSEGASSE